MITKMIITTLITIIMTILITIIREIIIVEQYFLILYINTILQFLLILLWLLLQL